jgi:hypothetical protein
MLTRARSTPQQTRLYHHTAHLLCCGALAVLLFQRCVPAEQRSERERTVDGDRAACRAPVNKILHYFQMTVPEERRMNVGVRRLMGEGELTAPL